MPLVVNGQTIDDAVIEQEFSAIKAHYESLGSISCCERDDEFRGYARDNITFRALLTQEAQRTIAEPGAEEVTRAFDKLKGELIDVIEWSNQEPHALVWKFPRYNNEIKNNRIHKDAEEPGCKERPARCVCMHI